MARDEYLVTDESCESDNDMSLMAGGFRGSHIALEVTSAVIAGMSLELGHGANGIVPRSHADMRNYVAGFSPPFGTLLWLPFPPASCASYLLVVRRNPSEQSWVACGKAMTPLTGVAEN